MPIKSDAQVKRTRKWIVDALLKLMDKYDYNNITISQIAQYAEIDRRTYYRHFSSKEDILSSYIRNIAKEYESFILDLQSFDTKSIAISFFSICQQHEKDLHRLHKHKLLPLLLDEFDHLFLTYHNKFLHKVEGFEQYESVDYVVPFFVGGFWHMLQRWIADDMNKTPEQLADIVLQFLPDNI